MSDLDDSFRNPDVPLTPGQAELRKLVLKQVITDPVSFWMGDWERVHSPCRTTRCISGWAQYLAYGKVDFTRDQEVAGVQLLGLTEEEYYRDRDHEEGGLFYLYERDAVREMRRLAGELRARGNPA
jgi:hypothetical protein